MAGPWPARQKLSQPDLYQWKAAMQKASVSQEVKHQHLVSRGLLRFFNTPPGSNGKGIGTVNLKYLHYRPRVPKGCGAMEFWTTRFTKQAEDLWGRAESDIPATINAVARMDLFQNVTSVVTLKAIVALHHARSYNTRRLSQQASDLAVQEGFDACIRDAASRQSLWNYSTGTLGVVQPTEDDLKAAFIDFAEKSGKYDPTFNFRKSAAEFFVELTEYLSRCQMEILVAPRGRSFVIGDTPVVAEGAPPVGTIRTHYVPPLQDSDIVHFPVHPRFCLRFPTASSGYVDAGGRAVDRINERQIERSYREVYFVSNPKTQRFVLERAKSWVAWPEIGDLVIR